MDLVFSDIHADIDALDAILEIVTSDDFTKQYGIFDRIINLGDVLERGSNPKQALTRLNSLKKNYPIISVMGNHDEAFLYKRPVSGSSLESWAAHAALKDDDLSFFSQNKDGTFGQQQFVDTKNNLLCVHGGPLDPTKIMPKMHMMKKHGCTKERGKDFLKKSLNSLAIQDTTIRPRLHSKKEKIIYTIL